MAGILSFMKAYEKLLRNNVCLAKYDGFQVITDPTRRKMMDLLAKLKLQVTNICNYFLISRTTVSKHLRILYESNLVTAQKSR